MDKSSKRPDEVVERSMGRLARNRMRIAWMYYVEGLTQNEIADRLGIGRVTVVRNINEALRQRDVKIWITGDVVECLELETQLRQAYKLLDAVVVPEPSSEADVTKAIGTAAGMFITDQLRDNLRLGVGWGATLHSSLQTLAPREFKNMEVVSLLGGIVEAKRVNPSEFAWEFATTVGADCYLLAAPAVVNSPETKQALVDHCGLNKVLERASQLDIALVSVGTLSAESTSFRFGFFTDEDRESLAAKGAVGDVLFNFFDAGGKLVDHPLNSRVMSVSMETLRKVPRRVMVSGGQDKVDALIGGMRLADCNVLITNESTAKALLARKQG